MNNNVVDWFRNILGWIANVDARDDNGAGTFGCAMPIADPVASDRMNSFLGLSLIYGEPLKRIIGYLTVDCVDNLRETILQNGWEKVTEIRQTPWGARGYVVLENGPVYYARDIDKTIEWFENTLGWYGGVDLRMI